MLTLLDSLPPDLLEQALTHPAFAPAREQSFERLEFLGDSVLDLALTAALFQEYCELDEGELSKIRAQAVSRDSCEIVARELELGARMVEVAEGYGDVARATATRLAEQRNALAALTESVIGAIFEYVGFDVTSPVVVHAFADRIAHAHDNRVDPKTKLQELTARTGRTVHYIERAVDGPAHDRRFTIAARIERNEDNEDEVAVEGMVAIEAVATGRSKQDAQQRAAAKLLDQLQSSGESTDAS